MVRVEWAVGAPLGGFYGGAYLVVVRVGGVSRGSETHLVAHGDGH